jgi:hypothetical protein
MEVGWISASVGGRSVPLFFRVLVCRGGAQVVATVSSPIKSPWIQPHLYSDVKKLLEVVWFSRISSG